MTRPTEPRPISGAPLCKAAPIEMGLEPGDANPTLLRGEIYSGVRFGGPHHRLAEPEPSEIHRPRLKGRDVARALKRAEQFCLHGRPDRAAKEVGEARAQFDEFLRRFLKEEAPRRAQIRASR